MFRRLNTVDEDREPDIDLMVPAPVRIGGPYDDAYLAPLPPPPQLDLERAAQPTVMSHTPIFHQSLDDVFGAMKVIVPALTPQDDGIRIGAQPVTAAVMPAAQPAAPAARPVRTEPIPAQQAIPADAPPSFLETVDPLFPMAFFGATALGTLIFTSVELRYVLLWGILAVFGLLLSLTDRTRPLQPVTSVDLGWGFGLGFVVGLPLLIIISQGLADTARILFPELSPASIALMVVFAAPIGETLFFRGMLQERRGFAGSIGGAAIAIVLLFWPTLTVLPIANAAFVVVFFTALAALFSYIRERYSLVAALICQCTTYTMLLLLPIVLQSGGI